MASQTALDAASWSGRLARPMSLTQRMRFGAGAAAVPQFQVGQLPAAGVGGEAGDPRPVTFDRPQLRAGVRHFAAGDDAGARQPSGQVQQPGQLGHVGAVARFAVAVVGRVHAVSGGRFRASASPVKFCVMPCLFGFRGRFGNAPAFDELRRSGVSPGRPACAQLQQPPAPPATLLRRAVEHSYRHPDPRTATTLSCAEPEMALIELPMRISLSQAKLFSQDGLPGK
jgi:hypothetical protein